MGGVSTVWQGTAFECLDSQNEIVLLHSRYIDLIISNETYIVIYIIVLSLVIMEE